MICRLAIGHEILCTQYFNLPTSLAVHMLVVSTWFPAEQFCRRFISIDCYHFETD